MRTSYPCLFSLISSLTLASLTTPIWAADAPNEAQLLEQINNRMAALQNQVNGLQSQVKVLKTELKQEKAKNNPAPAVTARSRKQSTNSTPVVAATRRPKAQNAGLKYLPNINNKSGNPGEIQRAEIVRSIQASEAATKQQETSAAYAAAQNVPISDRKRLQGYPLIPSTSKQITAKWAILAAGTPVFSSPYIGINSQYDGSNLIVNESSVNFDYRLLKQKQALDNSLTEEGIPLPRHAIIELSGKLEPQIYMVTPNPGGRTHDVDLSTAALDTYIGLNPWVNGFIDMQYDSSGSFNDANRITNSRIFLRQGFVTVGRLEKTPFYGTLGQLFVPFGQYSSYFISDPLTQLLGRSQERAAVIGYHPSSGLYSTVYTFKGSVNQPKGAEGGGSLGWDQTYGKFSADVSTGVMSNLAESQGMQANGAPASIPFSGFSESSAAEDLERTVPGLNVRGTFGYGSYTLFTEYVQSLGSFSTADLTFNKYGQNLEGAEPNAFHSEFVHSFFLYGKPSSFAVGWDFSHQALALLLPQQRIGAIFNVSVWRDTILSLEYHHDIEYSNADLASGAGSPTFGPLSSTADAVIFQFGVYF